MLNEPPQHRTSTQQSQSPQISTTGASTTSEHRSKAKPPLLTLQPPPTGKRASSSGSTSNVTQPVVSVESVPVGEAFPASGDMPNMRQSSQQRSNQLSWANNTSNRNSTGPFDVEEVQRRLKAEQDLEEDQRMKLIKFVNEKSKIDELCADDLQTMTKLGSGNGGVVTLVNHTPSNTVMARKNIYLDVKVAVRNQILRELQVLHDCNSPYIAGFYGAFFHGNNISICMEYMNGGSLDMLPAKAGRLPEPIVSRITYSVLQGLRYLHQSLRIIHRDVKPSNILVNLDGEVKLCDFGVSGKLIDSVALSFVGTRSYMAPERINGLEYTIRSDIWSLGLSLIELLTGRYPIPAAEHSDYLKCGSFLPYQLDNMRQHNDAAINGTKLPPLVSGPNKGPMAIFELLVDIVDNSPPQVPDFCFSDACPDFLDSCLQKDPNDRPTLVQLQEHPFIKQCLQYEPSVEENHTTTKPSNPELNTANNSNTTTFRYSRGINLSNYIRKILNGED